MRVVAGEWPADLVDGVILDGQALALCTVVEADDLAGEVVVLARGEDGRFKAKDGEVVHETLRGRVQIVWRSGAVTSTRVH